MSIIIGLQSVPSATKPSIPMRDFAATMLTYASDLFGGKIQPTFLALVVKLDVYSGIE